MSRLYLDFTHNGTKIHDIFYRETTGILDEFKLTQFNNLQLHEPISFSNNIGTYHG